MVGIVPNFSAMIAYIGGARCTGLHGSVVRCSLSWCLLATLLLETLIAILLLVRWTLLVWVAIPLIRWSLIPPRSTCLPLDTKYSREDTKLRGSIEHTPWENLKIHIFPSGQMRE